MCQILDCHGRSLNLLSSQPEAWTPSWKSSLPSCNNGTLLVVLAFLSSSKRPPGVDKSRAQFTLSLQTGSYNGLPVSRWRGDLDTGPRWQTVAFWILFSIIPVLLVWSYPAFGPGMDVPEASRHAKKSTCQKLEDQKKVDKSLLFFIVISLNTLIF